MSEICNDFYVSQQVYQLRGKFERNSRIEHQTVIDNRLYIRHVNRMELERKLKQFNPELTWTLQVQ